MNYSTESSDDLSVSNLSISAEAEVLPYCFEPKVSNSESMGHDGEVVHGDLDGLSPEWLETLTGRFKIGLSFKQACISD